MDEHRPEAEYLESDEPDEPDSLDADELDDLDPDELDEVDSGEIDGADSDEMDESGGDQESAIAGPSGDIEELVRYVASRLVQDADEVTVESEFRGGTVYVSLRVPESEMGRVIGREGRTAKAIRTLVSIAGSRQNVHARLDIDG